MLLFEEINDIIIHELATNKGITTQTMYDNIQDKITVSLSQFYKIINTLIKDQIIIKENGKLGLHNRWIVGIATLADDLKKSYKKTHPSLSKLSEGKSVYYETSTIEGLDGIIGDRILQINKIYGKNEPTYIYQAHPYYILGMGDTDRAFFKEANKVAPVYFLTGNDTFLDKYGITEYTKIGISALATNDLSFLKEGYCVNVIGSYILEIIFQKELSDYFNIFFESITQKEKFNSELFYRIFTMKGNCKLIVRKNAIQAQKIKDIFIKSFKKETARLK